jgi:hypothetical protein
LWVSRKPTCPNTQQPLALGDLHPVHREGPELSPIPSPPSRAERIALEVQATDGSSAGNETRSAGDGEMLWVGVNVRDDPQETPPPWTPHMKRILAFTVATQIHMQVLVGVLGMHTYSDWGVMHPSIASNIGEMYAHQPWRPFLAVYWSYSIQTLFFNWAVQQVTLVVLLRAGVPWRDVLAVLFVPAVCANVLVSSIAPSRPLCGASHVTAALLTRSLLEPGAVTLRQQRILYTFAILVVFGLGLMADVTNVGHAYAAVWVRLFVHAGAAGPRTPWGVEGFAPHAQTRRAQVSAWCALALWSAFSGAMHAVPLDTHAVDAASQHVGAGCLLFGCDFIELIS